MFSAIIFYLEKFRNNALSNTTRKCFLISTNERHAHAWILTLIHILKKIKSQLPHQKWCREQKAGTKDKYYMIFQKMQAILKLYLLIYVRYWRYMNSKKKIKRKKRLRFFSKVFCFVSNKHNMIYFPPLTTVFEH